METAALLLTRPKGRSVPMTGEAAKRANEYLQARPADTVLVPPEPVMTGPPAATIPIPGVLAGQHPPWLHKPSDVSLPGSGPSAVPVSKSDDPSSLPVGAVAPPPIPPPTFLPPPSGELETLLKNEIDRRFAEMAKSRADSPEAPDVNARVASAMHDLEAKWTALLDARLRDASDASSRAVVGVQSDLASRIAAVEARPVLSPSDLAAEAEQKVQGTTETKFQALEEKVQATTQARFRALEETVEAGAEARFEALRAKVEDSVRASGEMWASRLRDELRQAVDDLKAQATHDEEEMRAALVAQIDLELREASEQGTVLREEIE